MDAMLDQSSLENYTLNYEAEYIVKDFSSIEQEKVHSAGAVRMTFDKMAEIKDMENSVDKKPEEIRIQ